jgi:outer membrane immunogenic protein
MGNTMVAVADANMTANSGGLMQKKFAIVVTAIATLTGAPALAADMAVKAPPPSLLPVYSWTGFYVGANLGGGWGSQSVGYTPNDPETLFLFQYGGAPPPVSINSSGVLGGIQAGYNRQVNSRWLVGIEADLNGSGIKGSASTSGVFAPYYTAPFNAPVQSGIDWFSTVRARVGYLPTSNLLAYATAGFALGRVTQSGSWNTNTGFSFGGNVYTINCFGNPVCLAGSSSGIATGWTAGVGLEYALRQNWTLRAEYLYVSLGGRGSVTETVLGPTPGALPSSLNANFGNINFNVARVGLSYEFR